MSHSSAQREESAAQRAVDAARRGDGDALNELAQYLWPHSVRFVKRLMWRSTRRWEDPEAVANGVLAEVLGQLQRSQDAIALEDLMGRLARTAFCRVVDTHRRNEHDVGESALRVYVEAQAPERSMGPATCRDLASVLMRGVSPEVRRIVELRVCEGLEFRAIGERLGVSEAAARMRFVRALQSIRSLMRSSEDGHDER